MKILINILLLLLLSPVFLASQVSELVPLPPHGSVFTGNVRGYWFTSPRDFILQSVKVPTEASTGNQSIAILRFPVNPPLWSTTTDDFETLFLVQDSPADSFIVNIPIADGDIIGVLGWRGRSNSYAGAPYSSNILGDPITMTRLGMQYNLNTTTPRQIFQESGGSLSRVSLRVGENPLPILIDPFPVTKTDAVIMDNGNNLAEAGEVLGYTVTITNTNLAPAEDVVFNSGLDQNVSLKTGSVMTTQGSVTTGNTQGDNSVSIDIGNIPPSGSVTINYEVEIDPVVPDVHISCQGTVEGSNFATISTDDPDTVDPNDPTVTPLIVFIPTLSQWGIIIIAILLLITGIIAVKRLSVQKIY